MTEQTPEVPEQLRADPELFLKQMATRRATAPVDLPEKPAVTLPTEEDLRLARARGEFSRAADSLDDEEVEDDPGANEVVPTNVTLVVDNVVHNVSTSVVSGNPAVLTGQVVVPTEVESSDGTDDDGSA